MTDHEPTIEPMAPTPPDPPAEIAPPPAAPPPAAPPPAPLRESRSAGRILLPILCVLAILALAAGEVYLYRREASRPDVSAPIAALQAQLATLQQQQQAAATAAPTPAPAAAAPPTPAAPTAPAPPPVNTMPPELAGQLTALQTQIAADHAALAALQSSAIDTGKLQAELGAVQTETSLDHQSVASTQAAVADLGKQTARLAALGRVSAAGAALDAGQPLGDLPGAPGILQQYAQNPPPTEAALRLAYPAAARAAADASVGAGKHGYWSAVKARLENLVTISDGSHVIVGAPAAATLAAAGARLDAGDLAGAVALLNTLSPPAQQAMGTWLAQARDLVAARAALAAMAMP